MAEENKSLGVTSDPRQLRVLYLVDFNDTHPDQLDAIFAESFTRWGGRRTAILPIDKVSGIAIEYNEWLTSALF